MRKPFIAGNWKMYKTASDALTFIETFLKLVTQAQLDDVDVTLCPAFPVLSEASRALRRSGITLGAQDLFWEAEGAFTGEVSAQMLVAAGCKHVIIGHSERRQHFHETDDTVNKKLKAAITAGLQPMLCVGETLSQREDKQTFTVLERQLQQGLAGISEVQAARLVIAYEPVWAIGTGQVATPAQVDAAHRMIRQWIAKHVHPDVAERVRIQYGGSAKPENATELLKLPDVDGALVGGASLDPASFARIVGAARQVKGVQPTHVRSS